MSLGMLTFTETSVATGVSFDAVGRDLGQRFTAVHLQGHAGQESVGHREQHGAGNVVRRSDTPRRIAGTDVFEIVTLSFCAKRIPGAGVDDPRRDGVDPYRGELDRQP